MMSQKFKRKKLWPIVLALDLRGGFVSAQELLKIKNLNSGRGF
jgi:hypothetical protein